MADLGEAQMGPHDPKKVGERSILQVFLSGTDLLQGYEFEFSEKPDVRAVGPNRIGIELTRLYVDGDGRRGSRSAEAAGVASAIIREAQRLSELMEMSHCHINVLFNDNHLRRREVRSVAELLVGLVNQNLPVGRRVAAINDCEVLPSCVVRVSMCRLAGDDKPSWGRSGATFVGRITSSDVQDILASKETRIPGYDMDLDELWLVIAATGDADGSTVSFDGEIEGHEFGTSFSRVFLLDYVGRCVELTVRRNPVCGATSPAAPL